MVALSQVRVSTPVAASIRVCRGVRRVVMVIWWLLVVSSTRRTRCSYVLQIGFGVVSQVWYDLPPVSWRMLLEEELMPEIRRRYDPEFKSGAVRIVLETGKPIAQVARDLGIHAGTLGNWIKKERLDRADYGQLDEDGMAELVRLRKEVAELRMERDVLKRSVVLWVKEATR